MGEDKTWNFIDSQINPNSEVNFCTDCGEQTNSCYNICDYCRQDII